MKIKVLSIFLVLLMAFAFLPARPAAAAVASDTPFVTSITYQNVGNAATTALGIQFYESPADTTPIFIDRPNLDMGASTSVGIGGVGDLTPPFQGSAIMQSDQPLLATLVQVPSGSTTVYVRPMSNGFSEGADTAIIATVLKGVFGVTTRFSIQNVDGVENIVHFQFYNTSATMVHEFTENIQPGASRFVKAADLTGLGATFNGSAIVTATHLDGTTPGAIVGSAMELDTAGYGAKAFESVSAGASTIYIPSALCSYNGTSTAYAVVNTSLTTETHVTVTYKPGDITDTATIGPGAKASFNACVVLSAGYIGSAVVTTTPGDPDVIAVGKVTGAGYSTAFLGAASGAAKISLPYVRWAPDSKYKVKGGAQRTFIAVQNVGSAPIPANAITVTYTDSFGHNGTFTYGSELAVGAKFSNNPSSLGLSYFGMATPPASGYGGGALIECDTTAAPGCQLIAVARVSTYVTSTTTAGEDYNGMPVPAP